MAEESGERPTRTHSFNKYLKEAPFFCKIVEFLLCVVTMGLIMDPFDSTKHIDLKHIGLVYIAIGGYIIINGILIVCYLYGQRLAKKMALTFVRVGTVLSFVAGVVLIYDWKNFEQNYITHNQEKYLDQMLASGIIAIITSVVFAIEMYFLAKEEDEDK